jgi:hypothetical protein
MSACMVMTPFEQSILHADCAGLQLHAAGGAHRGGDVQGQRLLAAGGPAVPRCQVGPRLWAGLWDCLWADLWVRGTGRAAVCSPGIPKHHWHEHDSVGLTTACVLAQAWRRAAGHDNASQGGGCSGPGAGVPLQGAARRAVGAATAGARPAVAERPGGRVRRHDAGGGLNWADS